MIPAVPLAAIWAWLARFAAPIAGAFLAGYLLRGLHSEEAGLRATVARLEAENRLTAELYRVAEARRVESEARLAADLTRYQEALEDAKTADPTLRSALDLPLPQRLRLAPVAGADNPSR